MAASGFGAKEGDRASRYFHPHCLEAITRAIQQGLSGHLRFVCLFVFGWGLGFLWNNKEFQELVLELLLWLRPRRYPVTPVLQPSSPQQRSDHTVSLASHENVLLVLCKIMICTFRHLGTGFLNCMFPFKCYLSVRTPIALCCGKHPKNLPHFPSGGSKILYSPSYYHQLC